MDTIVYDSSNDNFDLFLPNSTSPVSMGKVESTREYVCFWTKFKNQSHAMLR